MNGAVTDVKSAYPTKYVALGILLLVILVAAVFGQTGHFDFVNFDDTDYVYGNPVVSQGLTWHGVAWAFNGVHAENWHPLTWLSHMLDCQLFGLDAGKHHLMSVAYHALGAVALFVVLTYLMGNIWRCFFVAALFAVHPLRAESVAWISERKDVLSGLFFFLTIGAYAWYARKSGAWRYAVVLVLFAFGLLCKPMLVSVPIVLLLLDLWPLRRDKTWRALLIEKIPFAILAAISCAVTLVWQTQVTHLGSDQLPVLARMENALLNYQIYLSQMIAPFDLDAMYPLVRPNPTAAAAAAIVLFLFTSAAFRFRRRQPALFVGWCWYLVMLLPVVGFIQVGHHAHADRYTYLPEIGLGLLLVWYIADQLASRRSLQTIAAAGGTAILLLAVLAWRQTAYWANSETLWQHTLAIAPHNELAHANLGAWYLEKHRPSEAKMHLEQAIALNQFAPETHADLASAFLQLGQTNDAAAQLQLALNLNPNLGPISRILGDVRFQQGNLSEALLNYQHALTADPLDADAHFGAANILVAQHQLPIALEEFKRGLSLQPNFAQGHNNFGDALMQAGKFDAGIAEFQRALELRPDYAKAAANLDRAIEFRRKQSAQGK